MTEKSLRKNTELLGQKSEMRNNLHFPCREKQWVNSALGSPGAVAQLVKNPPAMRETWVRSFSGKIPWRRERLPTAVSWPREFHGLYSPWGHKESNTTKPLSQTPWRRKCQPAPVFLPGKFYGQRSLEGYSPWGCKELDMTE